MGNISKKMRRNLKQRQTEWELIPTAKRGGTKRPGSMKKKSKSAGKHDR